MERSSSQIEKNFIENELMAYLNETNIDAAKGCPFEWWKTNKIRFSRLALVAQHYLSIPCTSTESERLFSDAGQIIEDHRCSLLPENAESLIFIARNARI